MTPLTQQEMTDTGVSVLPVNNRKRLLHPDTVEALSKLQKIVDETQPEVSLAYALVWGYCCCLLRGYWTPGFSRRSSRIRRLYPQSWSTGHI